MLARQGTLAFMMLALALGAACNGTSRDAARQGDNAPGTPGQAASSPPSPEAAVADQAAVRKTFEDYKSAITERRGKDAAALVDSNTLDFYKKCRHLALTAPRDTLLAEGLFVRMTTLILRVRVPVDELAGMDARQLVIHAVDQGWVGDVGDLGIGDITVSGDRATGEAKVPNAPDQVMFEFRRESGAWKIDLTAIFSYAAQALRQQFASTGMEENQAILELIAMVSGAPVPENIWEPPR